VMASGSPEGRFKRIIDDAAMFRRDGIPQVIARCRPLRVKQRDTLATCPTIDQRSSP
jgi:hypothetical protein